MTTHVSLPIIHPSLFDSVPHDVVAYRRLYSHPLCRLSRKLQAAEADASNRHWCGSAHEFLRVGHSRVPRDEWWAGWTGGEKGSLAFVVPLRGWEPDLGAFSDFPLPLPQEDLIFREGMHSLMYQRSDKIGQNMFLSLDFRATSSDGRVWTARIWGPRNPAWR